MLRFLLLFLFSIVSPHIISQAKDTIYLMNGQVVGSTVLDTSLGAVTIHHPEKLLQRIHYEFDQLYMVRYKNGYKRYYYVQDSTINNWFTREEMWMYMKGEVDARKGFKARGALIGSTAAGFLGGMTGTIWGPVAPYGFMALTGIPRVKISANTISDPRYVESDAYILGYERVARQKMKLKSLIGGSIGLVAGYCFYGLFHSYYPEKLNIGFGK
jgi:hypothetical protein